MKLKTSETREIFEMSSKLSFFYDRNYDKYDYYDDYDQL